MTLQSRISIIRKSMSKTQREMALLVGVGIRTWQQYEEGGHEPSWRVVTKLSELGYSADWLATGKGEMRLGEAAYTLAEGFKNADSSGERPEAFISKEERADRSPIKQAAVSYIDAMTDVEVAELTKSIVSHQKVMNDPPMFTSIGRRITDGDRNLMYMSPEGKAKIRAALEARINATDDESIKVWLGDLIKLMDGEFASSETELRLTGT